MLLLRTMLTILPDLTGKVAFKIKLTLRNGTLMYSTRRVIKVKFSKFKVNKVFLIKKIIIS